MRRLMFWQKQTNETSRGRIKPFTPAQLKRAIKGSLIVGGLCLIVGAWVKQDVLIDSAYQLSARQGLALDSLEIKGRNYTKQSDIIDAVGAGYGTPLLALSLPDIQHNLQQLGWVETAQVARRFPNIIEISLTERRPLALLQTTGGHRLIDEGGHIIFGADAANFSHLPVVSGKGAADQAKVIIETLRTEPELYADVWAIQRVSNRRWDVHLRTGLAVQLPENDAGLAWSKLAILDRQGEIMKRDLSVIDLRVTGQLIGKPNLPLSKGGQNT